MPVSFTTMDATMAKSVEDPRFRALLFAALAGVAVCLAMAGVYGVTAYAVQQRSKEIGLRMALGSSRGAVLRLILRQGLVLAAVGVALGLAGAVAATRLLATILFEVQPVDVEVYLGVVVLSGVRDAGGRLSSGAARGRRGSGEGPQGGLRRTIRASARSGATTSAEVAVLHESDPGRVDLGIRGPASERRGLPRLDAPLERPRRASSACRSGLTISARSDRDPWSPLPVELRYRSPADLRHHQPERRATFVPHGATRHRG